MLRVLLWHSHVRFRSTTSRGCWGDFLCRRRKYRRPVCEQQFTKFQLYRGELLVTFIYFLYFKKSASFFHFSGQMLPSSPRIWGHQRLARITHSFTFFFFFFYYYRCSSAITFCCFGSNDFSGGSARECRFFAWRNHQMLKTCTMASANIGWFFVYKHPNARALPRSCVFFFFEKICMTPKMRNKTYWHIFCYHACFMTHVCVAENI